MDFVSDALVKGGKLQILTIVDCFNRECLALVADTSIGVRGRSGHWRPWA